MSATPEEEGSDSGTGGDVAADKPAVPNRESGIGLGVGDANTFEPEEADTD